jgi:hypothetical protein
LDGSSILPSSTKLIKQPAKGLGETVTDRQSISGTGDDEQTRAYVAGIFCGRFIICATANSVDGFRLAKQFMPDIIISDIKMKVVTALIFANL